jgi:molybdopterin/thiamine biosynthesis adenylyltransferase
MKSTTLTLTNTHYERLRKHLLPIDGNEALAFALCSRRSGTRVHRLLVKDIIEIPYDDCLQRSPNAITWGTDILEPILLQADKEDLSIVKIHSHRSNFRNFSEADDDSDKSFFSGVRGWMENKRVHGSVIMMPKGELFGRYDDNGTVHEFERIAVIGSDLAFFHRADEGSTFAEIGASHALLFGEKTLAEMSKLSIAVVGCSGTGSIVIEQLARLGVGEIVLVDWDIMSERNLNRIVNSRMQDAKDERLKTEVLAERIRDMGLGTKVVTVSTTLWNPQAVREVAQCDVIFGCVDTIDGRFILNKLATQYLIPYFDLGVRLQAVETGIKAGSIKQVCGTVNYLQPGMSSLLSRGLFSLQDVGNAGLKRTDPSAHQQQIADGYISGAPEHRPAVITVNMFIASLAMHEFLCRLHAYREEPNTQVASVEFSLREMEIYPDAEGEPCEVMKPSVAKGDEIPLLGLIELSEETPNE